MKNEIAIMTKIMHEDNRLCVQLNRISEVGINTEGLGSDLFEIIADSLEIPADDRDNASDEYYGFIEEPLTYAECETFLIEWKKGLDDLGKRAQRLTIAPETI